MQLRPKNTSIHQQKGVAAGQSAVTQEGSRSLRFESKEAAKEGNIHA